MKTDELKTLLEQADPKDFADCLRENLNASNQEQHYNMLAEIYYNDRTHYNALSAGCKAALIIYLGLGK